MNMRTYKLFGLFLIISLLATMMVTPVFSATGTAYILEPASIVTQNGSTSGSVSSLATSDQSGSGDNPSAYVVFQTPPLYLGYITFQLPEFIRNDKVSTLLLQANFKSSTASSQRWSWSAYNWITGQWNKLGDSAGATDNQWKTFIIHIRSFSPYISSSGEIRIQLQSNNTNGNAKLDYLALHATYFQITPTVTKTVTATPPPTKGGYVYPITHTPSPTPTPTNTPTPTKTPTSTPSNTPEPGHGLLYVDPANPRYFTDGSGKAIFLTGSHTWPNFQDIGTTNPPVTFNYTNYLNFLQSKNHNFFRLWAWEQSRWSVGQSTSYYFSPSIYQRSNTSGALDGGKKFDLTKFNQAYFDRMRTRIIQAGNKGIYVSIMLFDGWSVDYPKGSFSASNPWNGHPYNPSNNINSIDGDTNNDNSGSEVHTLQIPAVTTYQEAYVRKVIDTVNDLDNVLYEISNESNSNSQTWQYHMIDYIKDYEATKPKQHPVGMTVEYPGGSNSELFSASNHSDWVSPNGDTGNYMTNPDPATGNKVIIVDSDHLWGEGGDRVWVWKSFTRGLNLIFMDCYQASFCTGPFTVNSPVRKSVVDNMGYTRNYANRMDLQGMTPRTTTGACSTQFCLVKDGMEYLIYRPSGSGNITVNLSAASGQLSYEWFEPATGNIKGTGTVNGGSSSQSFTPPSTSNGEIVLYIHK